MGTSTPQYIESHEKGYAIVRAFAFDSLLHTEKEPGLTKRAMRDARRRCKARVKYLFGQAGA